MVEQETSRWSTWAGQTGDQVKELRRRVQKLSEGGAGEGLSQELIRGLGESISEGLSRNAGKDLKTIKSQMYFVFFTIGMIYALGIYFAITRLF